MRSRVAKAIGLLWCFSLMLAFAAGAEYDCKGMQKRAARLAVSCCLLTRPTLDAGNKDCFVELKIPKTQHWTTDDKIAINACIEECNFISNGYIDVSPPFALDMEHLRENIMKIVPKPQQSAAEFLLQAYQICETFLKVHPLKLDIKFPDVDFLKEDCEPFALQITTCVRMYAMQECPEEFQSPLPACRKARNFFKTCVARIKNNS